ncbi:mitochondrial chaperone BCS1 [Heterostelium album PN500]|uniref:Mitochondrial chaperone BCS1 n=1 Tax=Heterostelium pallidum (strain ATCC 26659 / Pp 5 / PN500) TaxID=670386 RepID=D3B9P6_HETP5|nr:mitochondrial chaperone BCS1 [Heterostelium album PN500]EFA81958.1 mitochondrial chaperone BCS1 [Heterostelium album PN500]|eukprot:XP_020434075.1 mitochondrial chaperone BCS1 [Heterostelium album PN500]
MDPNNIGNISRGRSNGNGGLPQSILKYIPEPIQPIFENPFFAAGFGLIGVGSAMALVRKGFQTSMVQARRYFFVSVEIPSKDKSYHWLMEWLATKKTRNTRHVSVETTFHQNEGGDISSRISFVPSVGTHVVMYRGRIIKVDRHREKNVVDMSSGNLWESITLTTLGFKRDIFQRLLEEARVMAAGKEEGRTIIYTSAGTEWRRFGHPRKRRPIDSVILDRGVAARLVDDVRRFLSNANWYTERGIPYRRGYLLYGPPGTGKSSFITALAGELQLSICILNLAGKNISDNTLNQLLASAPQRSIILLEDIDAAIHTNPNGSSASSTTSTSSDSKEQTKQQQQISNQYQYQPSQLTWSGLLNALDGVAASEGRILFMTTNHLEKLDRVLIRPGRVDTIEQIGMATGYQVEKMFLKFFPTEMTMANEFRMKVPSDSVSPAALQGYFMQYSHDPKEALNNYQQLIKQ